MDQMQSTQPSGQVMPHIVQVYQPSVTDPKLPNPQIIHISHPPLQTTPQGNITYQQTITTESLPNPVTQHVEQMQNHQPRNQIVLSNQQNHMHPPIQTQVLQSSDLGQSLQITSHVILPQVPLFKQHMLLNGIQQQYYQYETYQNEPTCVTKHELESDSKLQLDVPVEFSSENTTQFELKPVKKKKTRNQIPNPNSWACNVRKVKHQRGEAYVSRRGKFVPERKIRNTKDCLTTCKYKCNERITDADRELIFKAFYSLNANEKKHFLLNTTERNTVKSVRTSGSHKRQYSFKYFFLVRALRHTVCKNFYLGTLAISQKPVYNVHLSKSDVNVPKPDGRGLAEASTHSLPTEVKDRVRQHISSFSTIDCKPVKQYSRKKQYLDCKLSVKQMYKMYYSQCEKNNVVPVKESMYRRIFNREFNLYFKKGKPGQLCSKCKGNIRLHTESIGIQTDLL